MGPSRALVHNIVGVFDALLVDVRMARGVLRLPITQHVLIREVVHGLCLLVVSTSLIRLLLFLLCSEILQSYLIVFIVLESLGILSLSLLLEVFNAVSVLLNLLDEVTKFRGLEEPHVLALTHIGLVLLILIVQALASGR